MLAEVFSLGLIPYMTQMNKSQFKVSTRLMHVRDIPKHLTLVSDSQDIEATLESIGAMDQREDVGCMFVEVLDGEYGAVYGVERSTPWLDAIAWQMQ
jgi:hypothetical protein